MALELGPHNIRVNSVQPTVVMTELGRKVWSDPKKSSEMLSKIPMARFAGKSQNVRIKIFVNLLSTCKSCTSIDYVFNNKLTFFCKRLNCLRRSFELNTKNCTK